MSTREASVEGSRRSGRNSASQPTPAPSPHRIKTLHEVGLPYVVHATSLSSWLTIRYEGLRPMGREHIHVCAGMPGSSDNIPEDAQVAIWVDLKAVLDARIDVLRNSDDVIMIAGQNGVLPVKFFSMVSWLGSSKDRKVPLCLAGKDMTDEALGQSPELAQAIKEVVTAENAPGFDEEPQCNEQDEAEDAGMEAGDTIRRWQIPAYYHFRNLPQNRRNPSASAIMWGREPSKAASLHAPTMMLHQALVCRETPHPTEGSQKRWPFHGPANGFGGVPDPLDSRRQSNWFGYSQQRWNNKANNWLAKPKPEKEYPEMSLDELHLFLTRRFGSLRAAFDHIDFFKDGKLSLVEWQEELYNLLTAHSTEFSKYQFPVPPRWIFNTRMQALFQMMDKDNSGFVTFDEFARIRQQPAESSFMLTCRRELERNATKAQIEAERQKTFLTTNSLRSTMDDDGLTLSPKASSLQMSRSLESPVNMKSFYRSTSSAFEKKNHAALAETNLRDFSKELGRNTLGDGKARVAAPKSDIEQLLEQFVTVLLRFYKDINTAFISFDHNKNGQLSLGEFSAGSQAMRFGGDAGEVFKALDTNKNGTLRMKEFQQLQQFILPVWEQPEVSLVKTKREIIAERNTIAQRRMRSPIRDPKPLHRGETMTSMDSVRPQGEKVATSSGFYSFPRSVTGRLDLELHPNEIPGVDHENFNPHHGPGYLEKEPPFHSGCGHVEHPRRGNAWKAGANWNKTERFGLLQPTRSRQEDLGNLARVYATYEGNAPKDGYKICDTGMHSFTNRVARLGPTAGSDQCMGLLAPKPIGPWEVSRIGLETKSYSEPTLLSKKVGGHIKLKKSAKVDLSGHMKPDK
eukprot:gnl/TRDRNA2_/TRDRNA2_168336_c1_seq1.p1 gnl/TRDRNA2_/TRDRNA2_168336_c1~~gnl/TRDRNA2_/TRDRNA2_168336_c1_seq1.p1  ORF type:complete len:854 (+),score=180.98 gnl/TRDRNA2_/TRDRNA2_168336_c1_seq1:77-2638(+)